MTKASTVTYYVVQPFEQDQNGVLLPRPPQQVQSPSIALRRAERLAMKGGAVAFSRTGDLSSGDFEDAVVIGRFGLVPEDELI